MHNRQLEREANSISEVVDELISHIEDLEEALDAKDLEYGNLEDLYKELQEHNENIEYELQELRQEFINNQMALHEIMKSR